MKSIHKNLIILALATSFAAQTQAMSDMPKKHDVNSPLAGDEDKRAPLHFAVMNRDIDECERLIIARADVDVTDGDGETPLICMARADETAHDFSILFLLLENRANLQATNHFGQTPLILAIQNNKADLSSLLLSYGATPTDNTSFALYHHYENTFPTRVNLVAQPYMQQLDDFLPNELQIIVMTYMLPSTYAEYIRENIESYGQPQHHDSSALAPSAAAYFSSSSSAPTLSTAHAASSSVSTSEEARKSSSIKSLDEDDEEFNQ